MKNIIFDLGGVLLNIDYNRAIDEFRKLGLKKFEGLYSFTNQSRLFNDFEKGNISPGLFIAELKKRLPPGTTDLKIKKAWCSMLLDFPKERLRLLKNLRKKYRLFLLSNTNEIHLAEIRNILKNKNYLKSWNGVFEKKYYSCRIGMRKPDQKIYRLVLKENDLTATETLFIDDSEQNIMGAEKAGLKTYFLKPGEDILGLPFLSGK